MEDDLDSEGEDGPIIYFIGGQLETQIDANMHIEQRPKKPRALVYNFFEWSASDSCYECKICRYEFCDGITMEPYGMF